MSDTTHPPIDRPALRRTVRQTIQQADGAPSRDELIGGVIEEMGVPEAAVDSELDALERAGFVYLVGDVPEVKLP